MKLATTLLVQLLPLFVFIVVDSVVSEERLSILAAIVFAALQLAYTYARWRRFDWFVLLDALLIAGLGGVSIVLADDVFFKIKPVVSEGVSVGFLLTLMASRDRFLTAYFGRMMPGVPLNRAALRKLRAMLGWICLATVAHVGTVTYAALRASKRTWAMLAGPGFYAFLLPVGAVMLVRFLVARRRAKEARRAVTVAAEKPLW